jgi:hypothetical protein
MCLTCHQSTVVSPKEICEHNPAISLSEGKVRRATIGEPTVLNGPVQLVDYNSEWPRQFAREADRIRFANYNCAVLLAPRHHSPVTAQSSAAFQPLRRSSKLLQADQKRSKVRGRVACGAVENFDP